MLKSENISAISQLAPRKLFTMCKFFGRMRIGKSGAGGGASAAVIKERSLYRRKLSQHVRAVFAADAPAAFFVALDSARGGESAI